MKSTRKQPLAVMGTFALILLAAWCPWITESVAEQRVSDSFLSSQKKHLDGCGFACKDCGSKATGKSLFGYFVDIEYACGLLPEDAPEYHRTGRRLVTFLGTVHSVGTP